MRVEEEDVELGNFFITATFTQPFVAWTRSEYQPPHPMKYLFLLIFLFAIAVIGAFLAGQEETPTENLDNVNIRMERLEVA